MEKINIKPEQFTQINNDIYGNPRYVIHFLDLAEPSIDYKDISKEYNYILKLNKKLGLGGKKFHNKQYGGGLVFQSYSLISLCKFLNTKLNNYYGVEKCNINAKN